MSKQKQRNLEQWRRTKQDSWWNWKSHQSINHKLINHKFMDSIQLHPFFLKYRVQNDGIMNILPLSCFSCVCVSYFANLHFDRRRDIGSLWIIDLVVCSNFQGYNDTLLKTASCTFHGNRFTYCDKSSVWGDHSSLVCDDEMRLLRGRYFLRFLVLFLRFFNLLQWRQGSSWYQTHMKNFTVTFYKKLTIPFFIN